MPERNSSPTRGRSTVGADLPGPPPTPPRLPEALPAPEPLDASAWMDEAVLDGQHVRGGGLDPSVPTLVELAVRGCRLDAVRLTAVSFTRTALTDVACTGVDLSGTHWSRTRWQRVQLDDCRASGADLAGATIRDLAVRGGRADELSLRFAACQRVSFTDVDLRGLDAYEADLTGASFTGCDLTGAQFGHARCTGAVFRNCTLLGLQGVAALAGAGIASADLMALSHLFAQALDIRILD